MTTCPFVLRDDIRALPIELERVLPQDTAIVKQTFSKNGDEASSPTIQCVPIGGKLGGAMLCDPKKDEVRLKRHFRIVPNKILDVTVASRSSLICMISEEQYTFGKKMGWIVDRKTTRAAVPTSEAPGNPFSAVVFQDLYKKGYFITSGTKFGGDYLLYADDPELVHSKFIVRIVPRGSIFDRETFNRHTRFFTTTQKRTILATWMDDSRRKVLYFELGL